MTTLLLDTSAAVALVLGDHEHHTAVIAEVADADLGLSGHAAFESFSVLTRLPGANRRPPATVIEILQANFPATVYLSTRRQRRLLPELASLGVSGGLVYDALVGAAAAEADLPLLTLDRRALDVYRSLGVQLRLLT